jgi:DNA-binding beta-propeller fold protein YncE|tara:strand:+ start:392 stop:1408 length:1017 start_codon:yes stop_codon:yes gene_type:complete
MLNTSTLSIRYIKTIGIVNNGSNGRGFANPYDVAFGPNGEIFVLNRCDPARRSAIRVGVCNLDEEYLYEFGYGFGDGDGQMTLPVAMAFDAEGRLLITDEHTSRVNIYSNKGDVVSKWGIKGDSEGEFNGPAGIAVDSAGLVYVCDQRNHRIQKYTSEGKFLCQWGTKGSGPGEFNLPWGIGVDISDNVYVADWRNDRVQKFDSSGQYLETIGSSGEGTLNRPSGVSVDRNGNIYVSDWGNERLQVFDSSGKAISSMRGEATLSDWAKDFFESNPDEMETREISNLNPDIPDHLNTPYHISSQTESYFWGPVSVRIDSNNRLYVVESNRHRIQIYEIE